eukprot:48426-Eustigmatos_ZCMA.PRE.1
MLRHRRRSCGPRDTVGRSPPSRPKLAWAARQPPCLAYGGTSQLTPPCGAPVGRWVVRGVELRVLHRGRTTACLPMAPSGRHPTEAGVDIRR